ncbi:hypothetical protein ACQP1K_16895 [Sphaerimonospora sp. CA-214678]|uniref:hypothetical protein n=1 Tax=Sphaerimonospora sp. CA-214678 TaxID=3240029 RepID=UPI003D9143A7
MSQLSTRPASLPVTDGRPVRSVRATTSSPEFLLVGIDDLLNNRAITGVADLGRGRLNAWGNSFPAEELPAPGTLAEVAGIPFLWANAHAEGDNVRCEGQIIDIPPARYDWIYLLAASERRSEDTLWAYYEDGYADPLRVGVSDFLDGTPVFGELPGFRTTRMHYPHHVQHGLPTTMWLSRVGMPRHGRALALRLPRSVALHVFAVTLLTGMDVRRADGATA